MEKASMEMDLEEWEFLPDSKSGLGFSHDGGKELYPNELFFDHKGIIDMNYFIYEAKQRSSPEGETERATATIGPDPVAEEDFKDIGVVPPVKLKQDEFVGMGTDPPESIIAGGIVPRMEPEPMRFDEEEEIYQVEELENRDMKKEDGMETETKGKACLEGFGFSIWRWRLTGIGALCSLGVAAATICIFIFGGGQQRQKQHHHHHNHKIQFQLYADDKRIKEAVQQATRLNQAISAARGAPMTRANISFGGYYHGL